MREESHAPLLSVIIPTLNEARSLAATLDAVARMRATSFEVIVVDGGSRDRTLEIAREHGARLITSERGRGAQMHTGACAASGEILWFLHADTVPPIDGAERIIEALQDRETVGGNFSLVFDGRRRAARFLTWLYPQLRRLGLCYGDSAIFVRRDVYERTGGFKPLPVFEDLEFIRGLRQRGRFVHLSSIVKTSSRRFEGKSFTLTFARWAVLQALYWLGVHPRYLGRFYYRRVRREQAVNSPLRVCRTSSHRDTEAQRK